MSTTVATVDEDARRRFEAAWKAGAPRIEEFLPPATDPAYVPTLFELVAIDLEMHWRAGNGTRVDEYLARFPVLRMPEYMRELDREEERARKAAASTLRPGSVVGRYRLIEVHARGGFGVVWRARDDGLGREVALKTLAQPRDAEGRQRFVAEARVASRLEHPGVVPVHELAEGETPWYSMKLVRGQTLAELIKLFQSKSADERALAWHRLLEVFLAVARALAFAHARGFMHRDIKPDNIIVGDYGETVLLDWGLARPVAGPAEPDGTVMGTPGYMPPEQAEGRVADHDARSDVYALGVVLAQILALERKPPRPLRAIAAKATERDKTRRYPDASALAEDVERYLSAEPVLAHREGVWEKLARSIKRHRTRWVAGTVAAVLTLAGGGAALWIRRDAELRRQRDVYAEAVRAETRGKGLLAAGRPGDAVSVLDEAYAGLVDEAGQGDARARIGAMRERAKRLATVTAAKESAWFLSGEERDAQAIAEVDRALAAAGPRCAAVAPDLPPERVTECQTSMRSLMLLGAVLRAKGALSNFLGAGQACEAAVRALDEVRKDGPTAFGDLVQRLCRQLVTTIPLPPPGKAAASPIDAHLFGIAYLYVGGLPEPTRRMFGPVLAEAGIDLTDPARHAIDSFREAVRLEPNEYWHSFMLAWALGAAGDYRAAGLVDEHCVALRPDYPRGIEARGANAILQGLAEHRDDLIALGKADYDRALALAPDDPFTHWSRGNLHALLAAPHDELAEYAIALTADVDALWAALPVAGQASTITSAREIEGARIAAERATAATPADALAWTVHAAAELVLGNDTTARASLDRAFALPDPPALAKLVRGVLALRAGKLDTALPDLEGTEPFALAARSVALDKLGKAADARALAQTLAANGKTEDQRAWAKNRLAAPR